MSDNYNSFEAQHILDAYKSLFPSFNIDILNYLDLELQRQRKWSCLTTNFHVAILDQVKQFDEIVRNTDINKLSDIDIGIYFKNLSEEYNLGYSLGICPWTDYLLNKSFRSELNKIVIIIGHDWYPIVPSNLRVWDSINPPLKKYPVTGTYNLAIPQSIKSGEFIIFFMNLYPDFREPFASKTGALGNMDFYKPFVEGFVSICDTISQHYHIDAILIWGSDVWNALKSKTSSEWQSKGFIDVIKHQHRNLCDGIPVKLGRNEIKSFPFPHPAYLHVNYQRTFKEIYGDTIIQGINDFFNNLKL